MSEPLRLGLLGPPRLLRGDQPLTGFATNKAQALLYYLAVTASESTSLGTSYSRATLAALLWSEMTDAQAKNNLRTVLPELRRLVGSHLVIDRQTVAFARTLPYWLDVEVLRRSLAPPLAAMDLSAVQAAVDLYQGEFLQGFYVRDAPVFEAWVLAEREQLHALVVQALTFLVSTYAERNEIAAALMANRRLLLLEPWSEPVHRQQMWLLAQTGERGAALAQYETCRRLLAEEFHCLPLPETTALYEQIRQGTWGGNQDAGTVLRETQRLDQKAEIGEQEEPPLDLNTMPKRQTLYGRQRELATLTHWLTVDHCQLVNIVGMGGQGKTTLAVELMHRLVAPAVQPKMARVIWSSLLNAPPLHELLAEWLKQFVAPPGFPLPTGLDQQFDLLLNQLQRQRCLLVLDNLDSILADGAAVGEYRAGYENYGQLLTYLGTRPHQSCCLLTGRVTPRAMAVLEEHRPTVRTLALAGLDLAAGQALLHAYGVDGQTSEASTRLIRRYSGNPLGLTLAACTIRDFFGGDTLAFLSENTLIFDDMQAVLHQQFASLSAPEQEILTCLAITCEPTAFGELWSLLVQPPAKRLVMDALRALQRRALLESRGDRFTLQNVITEFVTAHLIEQMGQALAEDTASPMQNSGQWREDKEAKHRQQAADDQPAEAPPTLGHSTITLSPLNRYALILAQAKEYVRASQTRLLLQPVAKHLVVQWGRTGAEQSLQRLLARLRQTAPHTAGYAAANLLHLLLQLGVDLYGYDFSRLILRQAYLRGVSLPHVNLAQADLIGTVFTERLGRVPTVVFSPDGRWLAAGTREGAIHLWRTLDQQLELVIEAHEQAICELRFYQGPAAAPATHLRLASAGEDQAVGLWQISTAANPQWRGQLLRGHQGRVIGVGFSAAPIPAGAPSPQRLASIDTDGAVLVWDITPLGASTRRHQFNSPRPHYRAVAFSQDGQILASGNSEGLVQLWQVAQGTLSRVLAGHNDAVTTVAFSADDRLLATGDWKGRICLWTLPEGQLQQVLDAESGVVLALAFSPDSATLASTHWDRTVRVWRLDTGQLRHLLVGHTHVIRAVTFSPDGQTLASSGSDQTVRVWDAQTGHPLYTLRGHHQALNTLALSRADGLLAGVGYDQIVHLWQWRGDHTLVAHRALRGHGGLLHTVAISPDGRTVASAGRDPAIYLWDVASGQLRHTLRGHTQDIYRVAFHPTGNLLASGSADGTVRLWNLRTQAHHVLQTGDDWIYALAFSPDGCILASAGVGQTIRMWDMTQAPYVAHGPSWAQRGRLRR